MPKIAIVAALERELKPLVRGWRIVEKEVGGRPVRFFEKDPFVAVCGGIGAEAARRAAEAIIVHYTPEAIISAGFAGALDPGLTVGAVLTPRRIVNASDGSSIELERGEGVLVSFDSVASPQQKAKLRDSFNAQAVDMEAAAVARAAEARRIGFAAVKVISDESTFEFPSIERFVDSSGRFREGRFAIYAAVRPWLWPRVAQLARNSVRASAALCEFLGKMIDANSASPIVPKEEREDRSTQKT